MDTLDDALERDPAAQAPDSADDVPTLDVELATVCMVDGIWQDQPDNVATFVEARLGDLARGRGNLYICLDISGEVEGRGELERALVEVIRDTYAGSRGSVSFGLSEALRAANAFLYDSNRQVQRELRRMAGVSAVVLRGSDLYICQAGPAVVYVEASEKLARFPAESDWFTEDAPLFAPQGAASAPLGIRREFASDLAHISVGIGDVFVLATRALTQLATTDELAIAFTERSAAEIGAYLEELGQDGDLTALVAELVSPHAHADELLAPDSQDAHIESFPVPLGALVVADESEPELEEPIDAEADYAPDAEPEPAFALQMPAAPLTRADEYELDWETEGDAAAESFAPDEIPAPVAFVATDADAETEIETPAPVEPKPVAVVPPPPPAYKPAPPRAASAVAPPDEPPDYDAELERLRAERAAQRAASSSARQAGIQRALGSVVAALAIATGAVTGIWHRLLGDVDWDKKGKQTNRTLNLALGALISFVMLLVRLVLPGAPASSKVMPRRATSDPVWLKAFALTLPLLMLGLAGARYYQTINAKQSQFEALLAQADTIVKQAEVNPDRAQAQTQLQDAKKILREATALQDSPQARKLLFRIQDQQNELDGVAIFRFLPEIARAGAGQFAQLTTTDQDVFLLDRQNRVYHYVVNDVSGEAAPAENDGVILKPGMEVGTQTVQKVQLLSQVTRGQDKALIVVVTDQGFLAYDLESKQWSEYEIQDTDKWGALRAVEGFNGNLYLLDTQNNQIHKYTANAVGYTPQGAPYFPANAQVNLSKAVDMAIDGDIWILNDNGIVQRFRSGVAVPFQLGAVATPLKNPVALYVRAGSDSIYIADAGNQRIVEFDKNGKFVREFKTAADRADALSNVQDLTVNELKRKVYFVNPTAAYMANLAK